MNNEPVAWLVQYKDRHEFRWSKPEHLFEALACEPLYTHPAKESKAKDRFSNYESICLQCGTTIYKPAFKTLTDEEIVNLYKETEADNGGIREFARAILRKAQEK
jgi:hypothetical protein